MQHVERKIPSTITYHELRHGKSKGNDDKDPTDLVQGRGDVPRNGLIIEGIGQVRSAARMAKLSEARLHITGVTSSELDRAKQSAAIFLEEYNDPNLKPLPEVPNIKELSQAGVEQVFTREGAKRHRREAIEVYIRELATAGLEEELIDYVPWIVPFGANEQRQTPFGATGLGETALGAALRYMAALEDYDLHAGTLVTTHAMQMRFRDPLTHTTREDRTALTAMIENTRPEGMLTTLSALRDRGIPRFTAHEKALAPVPPFADDPANRAPNASITEYTIDTDTGKWVPGRRLIPLEEGSSFVEQEYRNHRWTQVKADRNS